MRVVRQAVLSFLVLAIAAPVHAQEYSSIFGVKAGVNVAGLRGLDDTLDGENTSGFAAGLFYTSGQGLFSFQGELNYNKITYSVSGTSSADVDISYLQPAALIKVGLPLAALRPSAQAGVGYGFQFSCDFAGFDCDDDLGPENQFVGIFGVDLEVWLGGLAIVGDARYEIGFSDIAGVSSVFEDAKHKSWVLRAGIGKRF